MLGATIVALEDFDGEVTYRPVRRTPFGLTCSRLPFGIRPLRLNEDGSVSPECYVIRWRAA